LITARVRFGLRLAISAALIVLLLRRVNWTGLGSVLSRISMGGALAASLLTFPLIVLLATRWRIFLRQQSIHLPFRTVLGLTWAGQFFNSVLPGSTGGDVVKIYQLCRMVPDRKAAAAVTVIIDRLSALVALAVLAGGALLFAPLPEFTRLSVRARTLWPWLVLGLFLLLLVGSLAMRAMRRSPHWLARLRHVWSVLRTSFAFNVGMVAALFLAISIHLLNFTIIFGFARALGIAITYWQVLSFMPIVFALLLVPITVNGHGLREVLLVFYFGQLHISVGGIGIGAAETAVSLSLVAVASDLLWALPGGLWYMSKIRHRSS
jgi:uncharacterized protein (TIRG00374 family)